MLKSKKKKKFRLYIMSLEGLCWILQRSNSLKMEPRKQLNQFYQAGRKVKCVCLKYALEEKQKSILLASAD